MFVCLTKIFANYTLQREEDCDLIEQEAILSKATALSWAFAQI